MEQPYIYHFDLQDISAPSSGIVSKTLQNDDRSKVVQFCFAPGQELSAHTAPFPAILQFLRGLATVKLGQDEQSASQGTFVYMTPLLEHGIRAETEVVMLLIMLKNPK
ncbi:MAG: cupin domain-containing protein [Bryobacterales bacterium]|nr:cupin domain-containing protein [Bryobacterales bacterium]